MQPGSVGARPRWPARLERATTKRAKRASRRSRRGAGVGTPSAVPMGRGGTPRGILRFRAERSSAQNRPIAALELGGADCGVGVANQPREAGWLAIAERGDADRGGDHALDAARAQATFANCRDDATTDRFGAALIGVRQEHEE